MALISKKNKRYIKQFWNIVQTVGILIAIFSTIFTVWEFNYQQGKIRESEQSSYQALMEALKTEINYNLDFSTTIEQQKEKFKETDEWPAPRYSTIILENAINQKIGDEYTKRVMLGSYLEMTMANNALNRFGEIFIAPTHEQYLTMRLAKNQTVDILSNYNRDITFQLSSLKGLLNLSS